MTHGSLFSGIGGFDLAAEWIGWENVFHCEWNPFGQKVLNYYWPKSISYHDITKTDFTIHRGQIDILTGGFPCQPYSMAGKRKGKEDERHLWPEMLRAIREIQPRWVVGENVLGLVNWSDGLVFHEVQADLEAAGYEVQPYVLPAVSVNAPHRRDRVWFVAYCNSARFQETRTEQQTARFEQYRELGSTTTDADSNGQHGCDCEHEINASERGQYAQRDIEQSDEYGIATNTSSDGLHEQSTEADNTIGKNCQQPGAQRFCTSERFSDEWDATNANSDRLQRSTQPRCDGKQGWNRPIQPTSEYLCTYGKERMEVPRWDNFPTQSPVCNGNDGISAKLDGITFSKWRQESIKAAGNAIVPQVALQIFKTIEEYENNF